MPTNYMLKTSGINYDPAPPINAVFGLDLSRLSVGNQPTQIQVSTAGLDFAVTGDFQGFPINLDSVYTTDGCGSGCRGGGVSFTGPDLQASQSVEILRFAKHGTINLPSPSAPPLANQPPSSTALPLANALSAVTGGSALQWLVTMEDGVGLRGIMRGFVDQQGHPLFPYKLELSGKMVIKLGPVNGVNAMVLKSRKEPLLSGVVPNWPPFGMKLSLTNGPIEYYRADEIDDSAAKPLLTITKNDTTLTTQEVALLRQYPVITAAYAVDSLNNAWKNGPVAGALIQWKNTSSLVTPPEPQVDYFHIYRKFDGDSLNGWILVKEISVKANSWKDTQFTGKRSAQYLVLQAASLPFGYRYESLYGSPVEVSTG